MASKLPVFSVSQELDSGDDAYRFEPQIPCSQIVEDDKRSRNPAPSLRFGTVTGVSVRNKQNQGGRRVKKRRWWSLSLCLPFFWKKAKKKKKGFELRTNSFSSQETSKGRTKRGGCSSSMASSCSAGLIYGSADDEFSSFRKCTPAAVKGRRGRITEDEGFWVPYMNLKELNRRRTGYSTGSNNFPIYLVT